MAKTHARYEKGRATWATYDQNALAKRMYKNQILKLALSRFKWLNLPETVDERYLEYTLLFESMATIAAPADTGMFLVGKCIANGRPNMYGDPTSWQVLGENGSKFNANWKNGVPVYDNLLRASIIPEIDLLADELADIHITKRMNRTHQKIPYVLVGDQNRQFDMINLLKQIVGGEPAVLATEAIEQIKPYVLETKVPYLGADLEQSVVNTWNEVYKLLAIPTTPFKKERLVEEEVSTMAAPEELAALDPLTARRKAADYLNKTFGLNIEVVWNSDIITDNYIFDNNKMVQEDLKTGGE